MCPDHNSIRQFPGASLCCSHCDYHGMRGRVCAVDSHAWPPHTEPSLPVKYPESLLPDKASHLSLVEWRQHEDQTF